VHVEQQASARRQGELSAANASPLASSASRSLLIAPGPIPWRCATLDSLTAVSWPSRVIPAPASARRAGAAGFGRSSCARAPLTAIRAGRSRVRLAEVLGRVSTLSAAILAAGAGG